MLLEIKWACACSEKWCCVSLTLKSVPGALFCVCIAVGSLSIHNNGRVNNLVHALYLCRTLASLWFHSLFPLRSLALNSFDRGNLGVALLHDKNINGAVNERYLIKSQPFLPPFESLNFVAASPQHVYHSTKKLTLRNLHRLPYCLDG